MSSPTHQPTPTGLSLAACAHLAVAAASGTGLAGVIFAGVVLHVEVVHGVATLLAAITTLAGIGFLIHIARDSVTRRLDQLEAKLDASHGGFVDDEAAAAARRLNMRLLNQG